MAVEGAVEPDGIGAGHVDDEYIVLHGRQKYSIDLKLGYLRRYHHP